MGVIVIPLPLLAAIALAAPLKVALLPNVPLVEATAEEAAWLDGKLVRELAARAVLVPREDVLAAMAARGVADPAACDDACLVELGRALGADRVVRQTLSMQKKVQSKGTVWQWVVHQVDVASARPHGHFERMCMCARSVWDVVARQHAERLLAFDPEARLELAKAVPAQPTAGPVEAPGMVYVPEGEFVMGGEWGEWDEEPRHVVRLDAFYIDAYEVTNEEYQRCIDARRCDPQAHRGDRSVMGPRQPVVAVGWDDAVRYCKWAGKRLPTEAEWEKAARGTDERRFPWGDEWRREWVNLHGLEDGFAATAPVGSFPSNVSPYGAYDMAGNAWEWVSDFHDKHYYRTSPRENPKGPKAGERRVMRGGSWLYDVPFFAVATNRSPGRPKVHKISVGFRCAMDAPAP
ncbi:MAG: SUMF1/EgtB/PvdO family nonheme iron enzyme [Proteobacteria bacterium]|nr:SUMF1/EgtB/PvdO family nonheme iron enzyme [Pseudomonadota bacterium]